MVEGKTDPAWPLDADGVWAQIFSAPRPAPALFLDRDGVVVEEVHHLAHPDHVRLIPGAATSIAAARRTGAHVVLVTNQSGIGQGLFAWTDFAAVQDRLLDLLAQSGAAVDAVYACPFHPNGQPPYRHENHPARKPNPGMLRAAAASLQISLTDSRIVGDRVSDLEAGKRAGLTTGVLVKTGYGREAQAEALNLGDSRFHVQVCNSLAEFDTTIR